MALTLVLIAAVAENGVIGASGQMPWRLSSDLKRFKALTLNKPIIMGRKTFDSIGRPLVDRDNIVITRDPDFHPAGTIVVNSIEAALSKARSIAAENAAQEVCVIGGGDIYKQMISLADRLCITYVSTSPEGDAHFPAIESKTWKILHQESIPAGDKDEFETRYVVYERVTSAP